MSYKPYELGDIPVGYTLKQLRIASDVTIGKMAQQLDCHPDTVSRWERDPSTISLERAIQYCDILKISIAVIYR